MDTFIPPHERLDTLPPGVPERTLGYEALAFAAKYLRHVDGDRAGERWQFTPRQARFILWWYAVDERGKWIFGHAARRLAKGSGKSPWAAVMAVIELLAPVRLDHFDPDVPGGCIGKRVSMPWVQLAAVAESQTENAMQVVRAMISKTNAPKLHEDFDLDPGKTRINVSPAGVLEVISSSSAAAEGSRATCILADETEHWLPSVGGVQFHETLVDNLTKTGSRMIETLNAWVPDTGSAGEITFTEWCAQEEGVTLDVDQAILYDSVMAPLDTDIFEPSSLRSALEFVYQDCPWSLNELDSIISRIYRKAATGAAQDDDDGEDVPRSKTNLESAKRKYLNWPSAADDAWMDPRWWARIADRERVVSKGEDIVMFFDGSLSRDATALIGCCVSDGHVFKIGIWEPNNSHRSKEKINAHLVDAKVDWAFQEYNVRAFFADVREWEGYVKNIWPDRYADQLDVWAHPRGEVPEPIAWDMRGKTKDFTLACELAEDEIIKQTFTHDGDSTLSRHVSNARRYENRYGIAIAKESKDSAKKIDAAVCMIGARHALRVLRENAGTPLTGNAFFY